MSKVICFLESIWFLSFVGGVLLAALGVLVKRRAMVQQLNLEIASQRFIETSEKRGYISDILEEVLSTIRIITVKSDLPNSNKDIVLSNIDYLIPRLPYYETAPRSVIFADVDFLIDCLDKYVTAKFFDEQALKTVALACEILRNLKRIPLDGYVGEYSFPEVVIAITKKLHELDLNLSSKNYTEGE
jgi:hypothetical protein